MNSLAVIPDITEFPVGITVVQPVPAQFNCSAKAIPQPTIQWMRNGAILSSNASYNITTTNSTSTDRSSTLTILSPTPLDAGDYYCFVINSVETVSVPATLTVHVEPTITSQSPTYTVNENSTVTFQCTGTGVPEPDITWYRNGALITGARFSETTDSALLDSSSLIYSVNGSLTLTNAYDTDTDTGYSCIASNTAGSATDSFGLIVNCKLMHLINCIQFFVFCSWD